MAAFPVRAALTGRAGVPPAILACCGEIGDAVVEFHPVDLGEMADAFLRREILRDAAFAKFAPVAIHDVPEKRLLRNEEVTRIDVAVSLDHDMAVTATREEALFRASERRV